MGCFTRSDASLSDRLFRVSLDPLSTGGVALKLVGDLVIGSFFNELPL